MEIIAINNLQDLLAIEPEWQRLWLAQQRPLVFQHHAWAVAFIESFCPPLQWMVLAARLHGQIVGLLPVSCDEKTGRWRLLGSPNADYQYLLASGPPLLAMVDHLAKLGAKELLLEAMPEGPPLTHYLRDSRYLLVPGKAPSTCRYMELTVETAAAVQGRSGMRDNERRLAKMGAVEMRKLESPQERVAGLEILFEQHRTRWQAPGKASQFHDRATCEFYRRLCRSPALAPLLHFTVLQASGRPVACHFGFVAGDSFIYYKPAYDPAVKGAGQVLMSRLMGDALHMGLKEFDFTRGAEAYKAGLAKGERQSYEARIFFSRAAWLRHQGSEWLRARVPRDADGLALTTKFTRRFKLLVGGR